MQIKLEQDISHVDLEFERNVLLWFFIRLLDERGGKLHIESVENRDYIDFGIEFDSDAVIPNKPLTLELTYPNEL